MIIFSLNLTVALVSYLIVMPPVYVRVCISIHCKIIDAPSIFFSSFFLNSIFVNIHFCWRIRQIKTNIDNQLENYFNVT